MADDSWRTLTFRQSVVSKIDEAIRQSRMPTSRNSMEMENHVFQKAKTKEEYLGFVARLILHVREMNTTGSNFGIDCILNGAIDLPRNFKFEQLPQTFYERNAMHENKSAAEASSSAQPSLKRIHGDDEVNNESRQIDEYEAFGIVLAAKLRKMNDKQRVYCEHIINEAVFSAMIGDLTANSKISHSRPANFLPDNSSDR